MDAKIFRILYKSDFILTLVSDAGWATPFCIKFWTGSPSQAYYAQYDGTTYTRVERNKRKGDIYSMNDNDRDKYASK